MKRKWRPRLSVIVLVILIAVLALPLFGLFFFRLYENQLVRQTESELIAQGAALGAVYAARLTEAGVTDADLGAPMPTRLERYPSDPDSPYSPIEPRLDLAADDVIGRRQDAATPETPALPAFRDAGATLTDIMIETQQTTLAGFRLLDPNGIVIGGRDELGLSLAEIPEVREALAGRYAAVMRVRISDREPPPLYSVSRGTAVRVFVALPIAVRDQVAGVLYLSRTPNNIVKHLYDERDKVVLAGAAALLTTFLIGLLFVRTISRPMHELIGRTERIAAGDRSAIQPLAHHGTREMALLGAAFLDMARKVQARSDALQNFASHVSHELKSPLTAIQGAAELLRDSGSEMSEEERRRFSGNIVSDTARLNALVRNLLELARAEAAEAGEGTSSVDDALRLVRLPSGLTIDVGNGAAAARITPQNLAIIIRNLTENSAQHQARHVSIHVDRTEDMIHITVADDGEGISEGNRDRVFAPFFTTRREDGGTGVGLAIVAALIEGHGGSISHVPSEKGTTFVVTLPNARNA